MRLLCLIQGHPWHTWGWTTAEQDDDDAETDSGDNNANVNAGINSVGDEDCGGEVRVVAPVPPRYTTAEEWQVPPYARDGFERVELADLSAVQVCRTDERWRSARQSRTVSFRRLLA